VPIRGLRACFVGFFAAYLVPSGVPNHLGHAARMLVFTVILLALSAPASRLAPFLLELVPDLQDPKL